MKHAVHLKNPSCHQFHLQNRQHNVDESRMQAYVANDTYLNHHRQKNDRKKERKNLAVLPLPLPLGPCPTPPAEATHDPASSERLKTIQCKQAARAGSARGGAGGGKMATSCFRALGTMHNRCVFFLVVNGNGCQTTWPAVLLHGVMMPSICLT